MKQKNLIYSGLLLCFIIMHEGPYAQSPGGVSTNLAGWWKASNVSGSTWNDASGSGHHATVSGTVNVSAGTANFNPSVVFNGSTYYQYGTPVYASLPLNNSTVFSAATKPSSGKYLPIWTETANNGNQSQLLDWGNNYMYYSFPYGYQLGAASITAYGRTNLYEGYASPGLAAIYENGKQLTSVSGSYAAFYGSGSARIGYDILNAVYTGSGTEIQELITYTTALSAADQLRVNSYLAIKYGTTLSQTTPQNYLNSASNIIWNAATNSGYGNNIAGIGRDDASALNQKQSQSVNTGLQPVIALGTIAATNQANGNTFSADQSFETWGSDNGTTSFATSFSFNGMTHRMTRIWKVQETGTVGTVLVALPASQVSVSNITLLVSNTSTFNGGSTMLPMTLQTLGGGQYYTATVDLTTGQFFTFGGLAAAPGGVGINLEAWWRASDVSGTTWADASGNGHNATVNGTVNVSAAGANFNPSVVFNGSTYYQYSTPAFATKPLTNSTVFASATKHQSGDYLNIWTEQSNTGVGSEAQLLDWYNDYTYYAFPYGYSLYGANITQYACPNIYEGRATSTLANVYQNGKQLNSWSASFTANYSTGASAIGYDVVNGVKTSANSEIQEMVAYTTALSASDQLKVNSYLAIKYGITLDQTTATSYVNSAGTTIWNATTAGSYKRHIAGIGRDDASALAQKQSRSVNGNTNGQVTMGLGTIAASNAANTNAFANDKSFLVWSDNGNTQSLSAASTSFTYNGYSNNVRMNRIWQVQNTGVTQTVSVQFPTASVGTSATPSGSCAQYVIICSTDPTFATGVTATVLTTSGANYIASRKFPQGTSYFTFAKVTQQAPGTAYLPVVNTTATFNSPCTNPVGWKYYYYDAAQTQKAFAINWNGNTEPGGINSAVTYSAAPYSQTSAGAECNIMGRLMEILPAGGSYTTNGGVQVRIFFDSTELNASLVSTPLSQKWFKVSGNAAATIAANNGQQIAGATYLTPAVNGEEDGVDYVQFDNITSFSTFGFASNTGLHVLPVKLLSFSGMKTDDYSVKLNWKAESEYQLARYEVEASKDGLTFEKVEEVSAKNTAGITSYGVTAPFYKPKTQYRLKMVDIDGSISYSTVIEFREGNTIGKQATVYPNPVHDDQVTVQLAGYNNGAKVKITDLAGRLVLPEITNLQNGKNVVNISALASGMYYLQVFDKNTGDAGSSQKLVITH